MEPNIAPLAKRLAEENNVNWRGLSGSGSDGRIIERDVLEYLAKVMAGEESVDPTAEPVPEGMEAWPEEDVKGFFESQVSEGSVSDSDTAWPAMTETDTLDKLEQEQQELKKTAEKLDAIDAEAEAEDLLKESGVFDLEDDDLEIEDSVFITESDVEFDESILTATDSSEDILADLPDEDLSEDLFLLDEDTEVSELDAILADSAETDDVSNLFDELDDEVKSEDLLIDQQLVSEDEPVVDATLSDDLGSEDLFSSEQQEIDDDLASLFVDPDEDELMELNLESDNIAETEELLEEISAETEEALNEAEEQLEASQELAAEEQELISELADDAVESEIEEEIELAADTEEMLELESLEEALEISADETDDLEMTTAELEDLLDEADEEIFASAEQDAELDSTAVAAAAGVAAVGAVTAGFSEEKAEEVIEEDLHLEAEAVEDAVVAEDLEVEASEEIAEEVIDEAELIEAEAEEISETVEPIEETIEASDAAEEPEDSIEDRNETEATEESVQLEAEEVEQVEEVVEIEMSEETDAEELDSVPLVAASSHVVAPASALSYGVLLRRRIDMDKLVEAQRVISAELGKELDFSVFLLKAAAKAASQSGLVDANKIGKVNFAEKGFTVDAIENNSGSFAAFVEGIDKAKSYEIGSDQIELVVADMSALDVDEVVLNAAAPVLSLGRISHSDGSAKSMVSISGDISIETAAKFLAEVSELLAAPIRLLI